MRFNKVELRRYEKEEEHSWSDSYETIDLSDIDVITGIETTKDTFGFTLPNPNQKNKEKLSQDDRIDIYFYTGGSATSDDLVMTGFVSKLTYDTDEAQRKIKVDGENLTESLLDVLVQLDFTGYEKRTNEVIQEIIDKVNNANQAVSGEDKFIDTDITSTDSNGNTFPLHPFMGTYKKAYELIEKFSSNEYTDDGGYVFYLDNQNTFHWNYKTEQLSSDDYKFTEGDTGIRSIKIIYGSWGVYNAAIVDVGRDAYGHGNHMLVTNPVSMVDVGTKWQFLDLSSTTPSIMTEEYEDHQNKWTTGSDGTPTENFPNSYPYTASIAELNTSYETTSTNWVINSDDEFNTAIRRTARARGKEEGQEIMDRLGEKRYKIEIELDGTLDYAIGELCEVTSESANLSNQLVRIQDVQHNFNKDNWVTVLKCEQDPEVEV